MSDSKHSSVHVGPADLHLHSSASDGRFTPEQVVRRAAQAGLKYIALTDHDTLAGLRQASEAASAAGIQLIPGIELSLEGSKHVHLLVYGVSDEMLPLVQLIQDARLDRESRMPRMLEKLRKLGMPLDAEDIQLHPGVAFSRPLLARAMVSKGYVSSVQEAFDRFIGHGKPAYAPRRIIHSSDAIAMVRSLGCVPVLAHPALMKYEAVEREKVVDSWIDAGLMGIEAHHPSMDTAQQQNWKRFAEDRGLIVTAGSDYHGTVDAMHGEIGSQYVNWTDPHKNMEMLTAALSR